MLRVYCLGFSIQGLGFKAVGLGSGFQPIQQKHGLHPYSTLEWRGPKEAFDQSPTSIKNMDWLGGGVPICPPPHLKNNLLGVAPGVQSLDFDSEEARTHAFLFSNFGFLSSVLLLDLQLTETNR